MTGRVQVLGAYGFDGCGGFDDDETGRRLQSPEPEDSAPSAGPAPTDDGSACKADTNQDGFVNVQDLMEVLAAGSIPSGVAYGFGRSPCWWFGPTDAAETPEIPWRPSSCTSEHKTT
jgi:hypothetical protein